MRVTRAPLSTRNIVVMGPAVPHDRSRTSNPSNTPAIVITFPSSLGGLARHHSTYYVTGMADRVHQRTWTRRFGTRRRGAGRRPILGSGERSPPARGGRADPGCGSDQAEEFGAVAP